MGRYTQPLDITHRNQRGRLTGGPDSVDEQGDTVIQEPAFTLWTPTGWKKALVDESGTCIDQLFSVQRYLGVIQQDIIKQMKEYT